MHARFEAEFETLLILWRRHHQLRRDGAAVPHLADSRLALDAARDRVARLRRAIAPRPDELADAFETVLCPMLEVPVVIGWRDARRHGGIVHFTCACGDSGTLDSHRRQASSPSGS
jgi:hypothetical protein